MPVQNGEIATRFNETAALLDISGDNPFRSRAYRRAARIIFGLPRSLADMVAAGEDLAALPGIGEDLAGKIKDLLATGHFDVLDALKRELPGDVPALLALPGLGPKRVRQLYDTLGVRTPDDLRRALTSGRLGTMPGFGPNTIARLAAALEPAAPASDIRYRLADVEAEANALVADLARVRGARVEVAGSFRRRQETVGDLDILVTAGPGAGDAGARLTGSPFVDHVLVHGPTRSSVVLRSGLQVDLRVVAPDCEGAALLYFTGSKAHTIALRKRAVARGWKLNEYGLFEGQRRIAGATEAEVYAALGLAFIPPELREDRGEIAAAAAGRLPVLVTRADIRGDLHVHCDWSDDTAAIAAMAQAAMALGYAYVALTAPGARLKLAHGRDPARLARQQEEIDRLNAGFTDFTVLTGAEVDILPDGRLDLPEPILARLDLVVGAVNSAFDLTAGAQTERLIRALDNPHLSILAHPTGRRIGTRAGDALDFERLLTAARARGCPLEINAAPERMDLDDTHARAAQAAGVKIALSSDAHAPAGLAQLHFAVDQARRGWLGPDDVINTRPLGALRALLKR